MAYELPGSVNLGYASFSGWQIVPMPSSPDPREIDFTMNDPVASVISPYSSQSQQQYWAGGDYWKINVSMPPIPDPAARSWIAWLASLRGKLNVFQIGSITYALPSTYTSIKNLAPVADGISNATSIMLSTRGWNPGAATLNPGDYIQIGYRLYMIVGLTKLADANGKCTFEIWPSLREAVADGTQIVFANPKGLFRLDANDRSFSEVIQKTKNLSFKAIEAR